MRDLHYDKLSYAGLQVPWYDPDANTFKAFDQFPKDVVSRTVKGKL